jgi:hypothetical protein
LTEWTTKQGLCQVGGKTNSPCSHQAVGEIQGIPFCGPCTREQEAYFAIGKLLATQAQGVASELKLAGLIAEVGKH